MELIKKEIKDLNYAEYNPRVISKEDLKKLGESIEKYGFVEPVIINKNNTIIGGHQRVNAAKVVGLKEVPCVITDLSKENEKKLNLALNKIQGEWDYEKLDKVLTSLTNLNYTGFEIKDLKKSLEPPKIYLPLSFYVEHKDYQTLNLYFKNFKDRVAKLKELVALGKKNGIT